MEQISHQNPANLAQTVLRGMIGRRLKVVWADGKSNKTVRGLLLGYSEHDLVLDGGGRGLMLIGRRSLVFAREDEDSSQYSVGGVYS